MDVLQKEIEIIEEALLDLMMQRLDAEKMTPEQAQQLSKDFLALLPIHDKKEMLEKLKKLSEQHPDAKELYIEELGKAKDKERDAVLNKMRDAIHGGDISAALETAKTYTAQT